MAEEGSGELQCPARGGNAFLPDKSRLSRKSVTCEMDPGLA